MPHELNTLCIIKNEPCFKNCLTSVLNMYVNYPFHEKSYFDLNFMLNSHLTWFISDDSVDMVQYHEILIVCYNKVLYTNCDW